MENKGVILYGRNTDGSIIPLGIDRTTFAIETIDYEHHEQHAGSHYFVKTWIDIAGAGTIAYFMFITPNTTTEIHAKFNIQTEDEFRVEIYEGGTTSASGSQMVCKNNNRNSSKVAEMLAYSGPTVTGDGTQIWDALIGSRGVAGIAKSSGYEIIAKRNTKYLYKITKSVTGTHFIDIDFWWYEHVSKAA